MQLLTALAVIVGDLGVLIGALAIGWRRLGSVRQMAVDWQGAPQRTDPTGTVIDPARPGVQGRLVRLEVSMASIDKELHPNGGGSFHDLVLADIASLKTAVIELQRDRAAAANGSSTSEVSA